MYDRHNRRTINEETWDMDDETKEAERGSEEAKEAYALLSDAALLIDKAGQLIGGRWHEDFAKLAGKVVHRRDLWNGGR